MNTMTHDIFSKTIGIGPQWRIERASLSKEEQRLDLYLHFVGKLPFHCPECGSPLAEGSEQCHEWHRDDFFSLSAYIHAILPSRRCPRGCSSFEATPPWEREGTLFHRH
ncbi:MAG: hypothetical protein Fur0034_11700 [Desulfuromonadia bacterium]